MGQKDRTDKVLAQIDTAHFYQIESRRFVLWLPVFLGVGIWLYFAPPYEPDWRWSLAGIIPALVLASGIARRVGWAMVAICWAFSFVATGFGAAIASANMAWAPQVAYPMGETVEGRVIGLSRSASGNPRVLLDRLVIYGIEPEDTPRRVRLTMLEPHPKRMPVPGDRVRVYASLMPNGEPVEPGAFDFRRRAFFERLGGVGLTRGRLQILPPAASIGLWDAAFIGLARLRNSISQHLRDTLPGRQGAFAAAIIVGDRADIDEADSEALRASNLSHLLAISGLHMGILTGLVFALARMAFCMVPRISDRISAKKIAAVVALSAGAAYLALSGSTVATQRAFLMVAVAFAAVLADRPAITLRALALAATIILLIRPISLLGAGFQMSFAATVALVAGYEAFRRRQTEKKKYAWPLAIARALAVYVGALLFSSLLAGGATAPIAAFHFNRTAPYGLLSNLLALPIMGFWIAPAACLAAVLAPFGLSEPALKVMGQGIDLVLDVAHWVGGLPGAVQYVPAAPTVVLGLVVVGGLWLALWRGPWRFAGPAMIAAGLGIWSTAPPRPDILIAPGARLVGVLGDQGRVLDHHKAQGFAARSWLRRDGDAVPQEVAAGRYGLVRGKGRTSASLKNGWQLEVIWSKRVPPADIAEACRNKTIVIARNGDDLTGPCAYFGKAALARSGALSMSFRDDKLVTIRARGKENRRLWSLPARRRGR